MPRYGLRAFCDFGKRLLVKIKCNLDFDARRDIGFLDKIDPETGEVLKTAEELVLEACREHPNLRPCAKRGHDGKPNRWVEKARGCILNNGKSRCEKCVEVIREEGGE